jgi:chitinase
MPDAFTTCDWHEHQVSFLNTEYCTNTNPANFILIAAQTVVTVFDSLPAHTEDCYYSREIYRRRSTELNTNWFCLQGDLSSHYLE